MIYMTELCGKFFPMTEVGRASVIYSNFSGQALPLTIEVLGQEWVIFCTGFMAIQLLFTWSHGKMIMYHENRPEPRKILTNPNIIATAVCIRM